MIQATQAKNFQEFIISLCQYWVSYGCIWSQPYDSQMGAGTFHPHTFLKGLGPEPWRGVYVQPCRRPVDGRYGKSPYRFQHYYQLQVLLKPSPSNIIDIFLKSLEHVGINLKDNDIGLLEDDWKGPTLGAWGLGWEVRANAQEVTQFTYFQQLGGLDIDVVCGEITYGLERLYMYAHGIKNGLDIPFNEHFTYGDIYYQNEFEFSHFNFKEASIQDLLAQFDKCEEKVSQLCEKNLVLPAYDYVLQASHAFNLLDARGAVSVSERQRYIGRVRDCAKKCAAVYKTEREKLGYPLLNRLDTDARKPIYNIKSAPKIDADTQKHNRTDSEKNMEWGGISKKLVSVTFELGVEEMPPSFQQSALRELQNKVRSFIHEEKEKYKTNFLDELTQKITISSRRIALQFTNVPSLTPDEKIEFWGPAERIAKNTDGTLTQAGLGFCKKNNIDANKVIFKSKTDGTFLYFEKNSPRNPFPILLANGFKKWIYSLNAPLKMKWLPEEISPSFIRPVRSALALAEDKIIPLEMFGIESANFIYGQGIQSPQPIEIKYASDYEQVLRSLNIEICPQKRKDFILNEVLKITEKIGGKLVMDDSLLNKCAGLFESPYVFYAQFEPHYLRLPRSLICSVLKEHMNYFTVESLSGDGLLPFYIGVANYKCNHIETMIEGTKNVVTGRLDDGTFYYDTDLATPFSEFRERLKTQTFQENMGTLFDKSERLKQFATQILLQNSVEESREDILQTAALFCKADLKSGCVQEFPDEMQGIMGGILARTQNILKNEKNSNEVASAIEQHYLPTGANSELPTNFYALNLSLIDKLDSLCMMINSGVEPKGNKDPLGMRRLALSIARIVGLKQEKNILNFSLNLCIQLCLENMEKSSIHIHEKTKDKTILFLLDRVKASLKEEFDPRAVDSLTIQLMEKPLSTVIPFIKVIDLRIKDTQYSLIDALNPYRRARNLTSHVQMHSIQFDLLLAQEEKNLFEEVKTKKTRLSQLIQEQNYTDLLNELESLAQPLAQFFENVMVNDSNPQIKANRLALLFQVRKLYDDIADFSLLQV
ncbi:MAG: glycine--tRNA ligase subunit beta [Bdellovibrionota bacterium]